MKAFFAVTLAALLFVSAVSAEESAVEKKEDEKKPVEHFAWPGLYAYNWQHPVAFRAPLPVAALPYPGHYQYHHQWY